jgi:hypothetical protein
MGRSPVENAGLEQLALSTAVALDGVLSDPSEKKYVIASIARAHLLALEALAGVARIQPLDPFAAFVAGLSSPTFIPPPED